MIENTEEKKIERFKELLKKDQLKRGEYTELKELTNDEYVKKFCSEQRSKELLFFLLNKRLIETIRTLYKTPHEQLFNFNIFSEIYKDQTVEELKAILHSQNATLIRPLMESEQGKALIKFINEAEKPLKKQIFYFFLYSSSNVTKKGDLPKHIKNFISKFNDKKILEEILEEISKRRHPRETLKKGRLKVIRDRIEELTNNENKLYNVNKFNFFDEMTKESKTNNTDIESTKNPNNQDLNDYFNYLNQTNNSNL